MSGQPPPSGSSQEGAGDSRRTVNIQDYQFSFQVPSTGPIEPDVSVLFPSYQRYRFGSLLLTLEPQQPDMSSPYVSSAFLA